MDFLDSIDVDSTKSVDRHTHRKARRVRSWYLYEQFKALERNQMEATRKLQDRSYQELLLLQELQERRERRRLVDEFSMSDSGIDRFSNDLRLDLNDSFRSFSDFHNVPLHDIDQDGDTDTTSLEESQIYSDRTGDNVDELEHTKDDGSHKYNVTGTKSNANYSTPLCTYGAENFFDAIGDTNLAEDIKENLEYAKKIIAENIQLQLETVKENLKCLEEYSKLHDDDISANFEINHKDTRGTLLLQDPVEKCDAEHEDVCETSHIQSTAEKLDLDHKDPRVATSPLDSKLKVDYKDASVMSFLQDPVGKLNLSYNDPTVVTLSHTVDKYDLDYKVERVTIGSQDPVEKYDVDRKVATLAQASVEKYDLDHKDARATTLFQDAVEKPKGLAYHKDASVMSLLQDPVGKSDLGHKFTVIASLSQDPVEKVTVDLKNASIMSQLQDSVVKFGANHNNASITTLLKDHMEIFDIGYKVASIFSLLQDSVDKFDDEHKDASNTTLLEDRVEKLNEDHRDVSVTTFLQGRVQKHDDYGRNLCSMWCKLVSFSYQVVQLNNGNCYYDYSSQVLTAILACDILWRGLHKMCNILQPYVSPINFTSEEDDERQPQRQHKRNSINIGHRKKPALSTKSKKSIRNKESKKLSSSVWKNMSHSPIIFHFCGDCYMEFSRRNTRRPTSNECRHIFVNNIESPSIDCTYNSNETRHPTSSECGRNTVNDILSSTSNNSNDTQRPMSSKYRGNSIDNMLYSTPIECPYNLKHDTRRTISSECKRNNTIHTTSLDCSNILNNNTGHPIANKRWQSIPRISRKESSSHKSSSSLWPEELRPSYSEDDAFTNRTEVANPMLKLAKYMDTFLKDVGGNL